MKLKEVIEILNALPQDALDAEFYVSSEGGYGASSPTKEDIRYNEAREIYGLEKSVTIFV